jgi:pyruvate dehydrogenase (quinone)
MVLPYRPSVTKSLAAGVAQLATTRRCSPRLTAGRAGYSAGMTSGTKNQKVADVVLSRLREWGVGSVFGYAGDGINGLLGAWGRADNDPKFIQVRHEEMAALEAVGFAKFSGQVGVCVATSGPGAIHLLNGLYDALLDHVPVVAIVGQTSRSAMGGSYQQEVDLHALFKDACHHYVQTAAVPEQLPNLIDRAFRVALTERAPTCIIIPSDLQELEYEAPTHEFKMVPSSLGIAWPEVSPDAQSLAQAAEILNSGQKVAILVGNGARGAHDEIIAVADRLGAGVAKALLGKDVLEDEIPFVTGSIGLLGTKASYELMMGCDTILTIGSSFPYVQFMPEFGQARGVQIDIDGKQIGMRYPYEVNMVADAKTALGALLPRLEQKSDRGWREAIEKNVTDWWETAEEQALIDSDKPGFVNPMRLVWELNEEIPRDTMVAADSGSSADWYARQLKFKGSMRGSLSGNLATMGAGVPYAIGAKFAHPDRPAVALMGDGAMQMNGMAELITIAKYWREWDDPRLVVAVLHNNDLNQVTWELRALGGSPKFVESQALPDVDYAAFATSLGLGSIVVREPGELRSAWHAAFAADRPMVLDVFTDPDFPTIPPHTTFAQAKNTAKAILTGDPDALGVVRAGIEEKIHEILPSR